MVREECESGLDGVAPLPALALHGADDKPHLLADHARQESSHRMRLPTGGLHQFLRRCAAWPLQHGQDARSFAAGADLGLGDLRPP